MAFNLGRFHPLLAGHCFVCHMNFMIAGTSNKTKASHCHATVYAPKLCHQGDSVGPWRGSTAPPCILRVYPRNSIPNTLPATHCPLKASARGGTAPSRIDPWCRLNSTAAMGHSKVSPLGHVQHTGGVKGTASGGGAVVHRRKRGCGVAPTSTSRG